MSADRPVVKLSLPLKYQQALLSELRTEDELVILARGLGLLRLVTNLLHTYDAAGNNLVIVVGATDQENEWIGEALAEHHAMSKTSLARGLKVINTDKATVTTRVTPEALEAFIIRVYRQFNKDGFLKAFSDVPETFTLGFNPLANRLSTLFLRKVSLWPRFHVTVAESLEGRRKAEVIELEVPMTDKMQDIQNAVLDCVTSNISELKKANSGLDVEDWTLDSALHKNFDQIIRRQLDPVWHRVSGRTRRIAADLTVLRSILHSLLTYDCVSMLKYLDLILQAHSVPAGSTKQTQPPWLFLDAAHVLFQTAKSRVYRGRITKGASSDDDIPNTLEPVLEEQPKWAVLSDVLDEIEQDTYHHPTSKGLSNATILIMCGDQKTCRQLREYIETKHLRFKSGHSANKRSSDGESGGGDVEEDKFEEASADYMLRRNLKEYLRFKQQYARASKAFNESAAEPGKQEATTTTAVTGYQSMTSTESGRFAGRPPPNKRRRVRGGSAIATTTSGYAANGSVQPEGETPQEATLLESIETDVMEAGTEVGEPMDVVQDDLENMEDYYQLFDMNDLLLIHPYNGDHDEHILEETKPQYIIIYEPDPAFIRRVEVYRSSHVGRNVRAYFMYYGGSVEEQRYLSSVRREKDAFTKLIKEKGSMALTITHDRFSDDPQEIFLRTVNTRIAGGGRLVATAAPPTVVVDVREFRSALPSLLHGKSMVVVPCQLTVGDYILTPDIAVERKSIKDLIQSLRNGRLYNQAETLLQYYKHPVLLIEFDQNKSFTLEAFQSAIPGGPSSTIPGAGHAIQPNNPRSTQHLLTLLTLTFPRLKIIWSSSPYQTAEIFAELKRSLPEPDPIRAVQMGLDFDVTATATQQQQQQQQQASGSRNMVSAASGIEHRLFNQLPQDMMRAVPGVTANALERLCLETESVQAVANMSVEELDPIVGKEVARQIVRFFERNVFEDEKRD
ncbi:hypothetical protein KEM54_006787 [Ascosphaera aggregata]|nr:hypothetical protein KEM54_006787 [Ascosphaera aggregata]